jgi:transcriptional regulator with XRE-family HTH domain
VCDIIHLKRLVQLRNHFNLTQEELANILGVARTTYAMYEQGKREMDYETLIKLANRFNVSLDYLFERTDNPFHQESLPKDEIEYIIKSLELYRSMKIKIARQ